MAKTPKNIETAGPGCLAWNCGDASASLQELLKYVEDEATKSIDWYWRRKKWKARLSRAIQFLAVVLTGLAGLLPILGTLLGNEGLKNGLWASLLVGLAAALIGLDRAFGYSSGWARYVLTATTLRKAMEEFRMDWTALAAKACPTPTTDQIQALIQRAKDFRMAVEGMVLQETKDWIAEFQTNFAHLEKDVVAKLETMRADALRAAAAEKTAAAPGSIELQIGKIEKVDNGEVQVRLDGPEGKIADETVQGAKTWVHLNVAPGHYRITATAKAGGKPVQAAMAILVKPGEIAKTAIELPA